MVGDKDIFDDLFEGGGRPMAKDVEADRVACTSVLESGGSGLLGEWIKEMLHGNNPVTAFKTAEANLQTMGSQCLSQFPNLDQVVNKPGDFHL